MPLARPPKGYSSMDEYLLKNPPPPPSTADKIIVGSEYVIPVLVVIAMITIPFTFIFIGFGIDGIVITVVGIVLLFGLFYLVGNIATKR